MQTLKFTLLTILISGLGPAADRVLAEEDHTYTEQEEATAERQLHQLFDQAWEYSLEQDPVLGSRMGDTRYNDRWRNLSLEALTQAHLRQGEFLVALAQINRDQLSPADQLNYDLFKRINEDELEAWQYPTHLMPLSHRGGVQNANQLAEMLPFRSIKDYADWISRMRSMGLLVQQNIDLMRQGMAQQWLPPRIIVERIPAQIERQLVKNPEDSGYFKPFLHFPESLSAADQQRLSQIARKTIAEVVVPAYRQLHSFIVQEYLPACRDNVGAWALPDGRSYYEYLARHYTSTDLSPDEIHDLGIAEVQRIKGEMQQIIDALEFPGSFKDFLSFLRSDPQFYYSDPQQLYQAYLATSKRIDPELVKLFGTLPRVPYGVRPIPEATAPDTTTAYYMPPAADGSRAGYYYVNLYKPETRPKYEIEVLTVHEAMPGHHLQIALAQEMDDLPAFRKHMGATAFVEGWGLYSESLGSELGLYQDPYSRFGQLTYEMWRAVRLVVDTGLHYRGWTRQQAIDYFLENAAKTELDIVNEIDRYISNPGQALAYKIGELRIKQLRTLAETRLGDAFDVREFHDVLLGAGALPLDLLGRRIEDWISGRLQELHAGTAQQ
jgi:prolyl oligopeptidase